MATYTFDSWPKGIIKRDVRIFVGDETKQRDTKQVSPPSMTVDLGPFDEGTRLRLVFIAYHTGGQPNKQTEEKIYTIPPRPDVPDDVSGTLTSDWGDPVPEGDVPADQGGGTEQPPTLDPSAPAPAPAPTPEQPPTVPAGDGTVGTDEAPEDQP